MINPDIFHQLPSRTGSLPRALRRVSGRFLLTLTVTALAACKIVVIVPEGGKVVTEDGFECLAGQTCYVEVTDDSFDSTFTAMPLAGYSFSRWKQKSPGFCVNKTAPCYLSTTSYGSNTAILDFLAGDQEFFLQPEFVHYDLGYWRQVLEEIEGAGFTTDNFLYAIKPVVGNCDPGALTPAAKERALKALNKVRDLHYLPGAEQDGFYDMQMQESSLVQRANNYLNHFPDPGDTCYTAGAEEGASTSNLYGGTGQSDPASDIFGWTNDNNNIAALMEAGHRRWILFPQLGYMSYGQVEGFASQKVFGFGTPPANQPSEELEFVAMPYQHYPYVMVSQGDKPTPWSFSMAPPTGATSSFDYFSSATVSVNEKASGKTLSVQNLHRDNKGFGLANFLSWMVEGWNYDTDYIVTIGNIRMPGGELRDIEYPVTVDRYNLLNLEYPRESGDSREANVLTGTFNSGLDKDSYTIALAGNTTVTGQSEFSNQGFFVLVYDKGKNLVKSSDQAFSRDFSKGKYTIVISLCDESGLCYQGTKTYTVRFN